MDRARWIVRQWACMGQAIDCLGNESGFMYLQSRGGFEERLKVDERCSTQSEDVES
jgi:hypothetical protein